MVQKVKKKVKKWLPVLITVLAITGTFLYIKSKNSIVKVSTTKAEVRTIAKTISASGETAVLDDFTKRALIGGSVKVIKFKSGDEVKKGDIIIEMDQASLRASLDNTYSAYLGAKADSDSYGQKITAAKATESIRKRERDEAWRTYMDDNGETNKQAYKNAEALYQTALSSLTALIDGEKTVQNTVYSSYSTYSSALSNFNNSVTTSPTDGKLALANIYVGSYVTAGQELFSVARPQNIVFRAEIDEADISHMKVGMKAKISLDSYPGEAFEGSVANIDAKVEILTSGSAVIYADIAIADSKILPILGLSGSADIEFDKSENVISIVPDAVYEDAGKKYVYIVVADTLVKKAVELGFEGNEYVGILSGVNEGDVVVTGVADLKLKDGQRVSVATQ
jgi:HlyD family secretion protein